MGRGTWWLAACATLAMACTLPESSDPAPRCEVDADCAAAAHCHAGFCVPDDPASGDAHGDAGTEERRCSGEERLCGDDCVEVAKSDRHCGACNVACEDGESCTGGHCREKD